MKKLLILLLAMLAPVFLRAQDWDKFGLKGEVNKVQVRTDESWNMDYEIVFRGKSGVERFSLETPDGPIAIRDVSHTNGGLKGSYGGRAVTITVSGGKISAASYTDGDGMRHTLKYTYNSNGFLSKVTETKTWTSTSYDYVQSKATIDTQGADKILKQMQQTTDPAKLARLEKQYQQAVKNAKVRTSGGYTKEQKKNHSTSQTREYYSYQKDDIGNWTQRSCKNDYGNTIIQWQTIEYDKSFLSKQTWETVKASGDLKKVEAFATDENISPSYQRQAAEYWNERCMAQAGENIDALCAVAASPIVNAANKQKALTTVREWYYQERVMKETDYEQVRELADLKSGKMDIFDDDYKSKILQRSEQLRNELLEKYRSQVSQAYEAQDYAGASMYAKKMLEVDGTNDYARDIWDQSDYSVIKRKEQLGAVTEDDYSTFMIYHPRSQHYQEIVNSRSEMYTNKSKHYYVSQEDVDKLNSWGADKDIVKKVEHRIRHQEFVTHRGKFFYLGPDFDWTIGGANMTLGAGLRARFGYVCNIVNLSLGLKYNYLTSTRGIFTMEKNMTTGYFDRRYLSVPVELHINTSRDYTNTGYVSLGAEINFDNLGSNVVYPIFYQYYDGVMKKERLKDKHIANKNVIVSPKVALGYKIEGCECELYMIYDTDSFFDKEYIEDHYMNGAYNIKNSIFKRQVENKDLADKLRFGVVLRFMF